MSGATGGRVVLEGARGGRDAIVHSRSGLPGGRFTVAADAATGVLVAVTDEGGPWRGRAPDSYPHGLEIVRQRAASVDITGGEAGRTARLAFPWDGASEV